MHSEPIGNKIDNKIQRNKKPRGIVWILLLAFSVLAAVQCAPQKRYKILKVFFDGVPEPGAKKIEKKVEVKKTTARTAPGKAPEKWQSIKSRHPDYFKNVCNNCHDNTAANYMRTAKKEDICFTCHKPEHFTGAFVHGPVAVNACLTCHLPHESTHPKLLKKAPAELCAHCHAQPSFSPSARCKRDRDCTGCHYPHAAPKRFFLKTPGDIPPVNKS